MLNYDEIIKKLDHGKSNREVANELGCQELIIRRCYRSHKLKLDLTPEEKAQFVSGINYKHFTELMRTATEDIIYKLYNSNASLGEIAEAIGTTKTRVCQILRELASKENAKIIYDNDKKNRLSATEIDEQLKRVEKEVFIPQKVTINSKKYLDVTALYMGA